MGSRIRVAGGGLSGLATAVLLARQGAEVEVFDRRVGGGGRFWGGWQVLDNGLTPTDALVEFEQLGFPGVPPVRPARRAVLLDAFGGRHEVASAEPYTYFIRRGGEGSLDAWLRDEALASGVALHEGHNAPPGTEVIATGPRRADGVAHELVFRSDLPDTVMVLFDPTVTPSGYAYLFCHEGHATFGVAQVRRLRTLPEAHRMAWARFRRELGGFAVEDPHEGGQRMAFAPPRSLRGADGRWYVGEAAGVQHFLFGLGNRLALRTAALAASGVAGLWDPERYERILYRPMLASLALRWAYERLGRRGFKHLCRLASRLDFRNLLLWLNATSGLRRGAARLVMAAWRENGDESGPLPGAWHRRRERA
ncbi:MAG TPA: NAD(P)-binding protein [Thermoanaerobaculaceae bacterium]|nr:NAD(P)-binding protein [Thermoanaerobaculaceae bacterium]HRS16799.1 NAD(P)-binding protein [Thermoanaerobaculaceae bacterium]